MLARGYVWPVWSRPRVITLASVIDDQGPLPPQSSLHTTTPRTNPEEISVSPYTQTELPVVVATGSNDQQC